MVFKEMYYVRHRYTGEIAFVALGEKYDQHVWDLLYSVPKPETKGVSMPEFNKQYTYGEGRVYYTLKLDKGNISLVTNGRVVTSEYALMFHLQEVTEATGFRYA